MADPRLKTAAGFSRLAGIYDRLAGLVYGKSLRKAQTAMLPLLKPEAKVLVLGGGTGWFLEELLKHANPTEVVYVELSEGMMRRSQERIQKACPENERKVQWELGTVHNLANDEAFDLVCTHCFLDLFEGEALHDELKAINQRLRPHAQWYFSDFKVVEKGWMRLVSKALIQLMYLFFRWLCGIQAGKLSDFKGEIRKRGFEAKEQRRFFKGMIEAVLFSRQV